MNAICGGTRLLQYLNNNIKYSIEYLPVITIKKSKIMGKYVILNRNLVNINSFQDFSSDVIKCLYELKITDDKAKQKDIARKIFTKLSLKILNYENNFNIISYEDLTEIIICSLKEVLNKPFGNSMVYIILVNLKKYFLQADF